jgi:hypothetical protein
MTGHEEVGRLLGATILPPFRRHGEMLASNGEKVGRTNNVPRGKGTNREKVTLTDLTLEALVNRTPAVWVGKQCPIPL